MNPTLRLGLLILGAAVLASAVAAWTSKLPAFPLLLPLLLGAAFTVPRPNLTRISVAGAVAAELGSGLPPGTVFLATFVPPHILHALVRWQRPALPIPVRWLISALFLLAVLSILQVMNTAKDPHPPWRHPRILERKVISPAIIGGLLAAAVPQLLEHGLAQRLAHFSSRRKL